MIPCGLLLAALLGAPPALKSAVVVGVNEPFDASQPTLAYADDDAARFAELFDGQLDRVELLTVLDAESQGLYPALAARARPPTEAQLGAALARLEEAAAEARRSGRRTELYFVYVGHGRTRGGEGEVKLLDSVLSRSALFSRVLGRQAHDRLHLIIDACDAYHLVNARGEVAADLDGLFERALDAQTLTNVPEAGAILSTRGRAQTHEWSRYQGGVFSHEVRSALAGAADVDQDGRVDYVELEAFLAAANSGVPELKGRPKVFVRSPAIERGAAVVELPRERPRVLLAPELSGRFWLEDQRGLRYAELHKPAGLRVALVLRPEQAYELFDASGARVAHLSAGEAGREISPPLTPEPVERRGRGVEEPEGIFREAFGPAYVEGFRARSLLTTAPPPEREDNTLLSALGLSAGGVAVVLGGVAVAQQLEANARYADYRGTGDASEVSRFGAEAEAARQRTLVLSIGAGVGAAAAATLLYFAYAD